MRPLLLAVALTALGIVSALAWTHGGGGGGGGCPNSLDFSQACNSVNFALVIL